MQLDTRLPLLAAQQPALQFQPETRLESLGKIAPAINAMRQMQAQQQTQQREMQAAMRRSAALDEMRLAMQDEDLGKYAQALMNSGDEALMQKGAQLQMADLQDKQFRRQYGGMTGNLTPQGMAALAGTGEKGLKLSQELGRYVPGAQPIAVGRNVYVPGQGFQTPPETAEAPIRPQVLRGGDVLVNPQTGEQIAANALVPRTAPAAGMSVDQRTRMLNARGYEEVDGKVRPIPGGFADPEVIRRQTEARRPPPPSPEGTPAQQQRAQSRSEAQQQLSQELQTVLGYYNELGQMGAMTSPERSTAANVIAAARATWPGQTAERFAGTRAQTLRDNIANARLRILNHVKNATGATASQMNSNVEFQTWLNALTSPGQSIETVRETLKQLDAVLGSVRTQVQREAQGAAPAPAPARPGAAAPAPARTGGARREIAPGVFVTERP